MNNVIATLCFVVCASALTSTAAAQPMRESAPALGADIAPRARRADAPSVAPHLADDAMTLRAPDAGDYALPILGVVFGGAAVIAGAVGALGSGLVLLALHDRAQSNAGIWLGGSAALAVVGALSLGISISTLVGLRHRSRDAAAADAETGVRVFQFTPIAGGAMVGVSGTY